MNAMLETEKQERFLTTSEAAKTLGVTDGWIRRLLLRRTLTGVKVSSLVWLIPESEIQKYIATKKPVGRPSSQVR